VVGRGANTWEYTYDALGNRVRSVNNAMLTNFVIDPLGLGNLVGEYDSENNQATRFDYGFGLINRSDIYANIAYYSFDAIGSTSNVSNALGVPVNHYVYEPFGAITFANETSTNPFLYVGEWGVMNADSGLNFMRARHYSSEKGRFISSDLIGITGGINYYMYSINNPILFIDPSGLINWCTVMGGLDQVLGGTLITGGGTVLAFAPTVISQAIGITAVYFGYQDMRLGIIRIIRGLDDLPDLPATTFPGMIAHDVGASSNIIHGVDLGYGVATIALPGSALLSAATVVAGETYSGFCALSTDSKQPFDPNTETSSEDENPVTRPVDPNCKTGPAGFSEASFVKGDSLLPYRIDFENDPSATSPAQVVYIWDPLISDLNTDTFELAEIGFGDTNIAVPPGLQYYETTVPMTYQNVDFEVRIEAGLRGTDEVFINFYSINPETELPPTGGIGFLPPEDGTGRGQGHLSYLIRAREGLASGTEIRNVANIQFSFGEIIATNQVDPHDPGQGTDPEKEALVTIDNGVPTSHVLPLPAESASLSFEVTWTGEDEPGGSGIAFYDIWAQDNGGPWQLWQQKTAAVSGSFTGENGHTYCFYSVATDNVGHQEDKTPGSETCIHVETGEPVEGEPVEGEAVEGEPVEGEPPVERVTVPDVIGKSKDEAIALLKEMGLQVVVQEENNKAPKDEVVTQAPAAGIAIDKGATVTLMISTGYSGSLCGCGPATENKGGHKSDLILLVLLSFVLLKPWYKKKKQELNL